MNRAAPYALLACLLGASACSETPPPADTQASKMAVDAPGAANSPTATCTAPAAATVTGMKLLPQTQKNWCWAASAEMILDKLGGRVAQCKQADHRLTETTCCSNPSACDKGGWPDFPQWGFTKTRLKQNAALTWAGLTNEIGCHDRPVLFSWHYKTSTGELFKGHVMVAYGYEVENGVQQVQVYDPSPVNQGTEMTISYSAYVSGVDYAHWHDFYNIAR
jgi:hypothetical protein